MNSLYSWVSHPVETKHSFESSVQPGNVAAAFLFSELMHILHQENGKNMQLIPELANLSVCSLVL